MPADDGERRVSGPLVLAVESSCDETGIALVEGGRRIHANVVACQVALHAATGGIVPEVAARAHLRWIVPVLDEAWADAGVDAGRPRRGRRHLRARVSRARCSSASTSRRRWPGSTTCRSSGVNHLEGHVYAAWLLDPGEAGRARAGLPARRARRLGRAHVPRRDARPPDLPAPRHDRRRRGRRGVRQGRPAARASAIRAARRSRGRPRRATSRDRVFPRAWLGDTYDFSFSGLKTAARRIVARAPGPTRAWPTTPDAPLPDAVVAELAWGFQDSVVDVLATKTIRAAEAVGARSIVLGGGVAANRRPARPPGRRGRGARRPARSCRGPALCTDNGAMIGAAGGPAVRGRRPRRARPRRAAVAAAGRPVSARGRRPRLDAADGPGRRSAAAGLRARHSAVAELPRRRRRARGDPAEAAPAPGRARPRDRAGARAPHGRAARGGRARSPRSSSTAASPRSCATGSPSRARGRRGSRARRGRRARPGPRRTSSRPPYDVVANLPYHITSPILHALLGAPPRPERLRADGPARGRASGSRRRPGG